MQEIVANLEEGNAQAEESNDENSEIDSENSDDGGGGGAILGGENIDLKPLAAEMILKLRGNCNTTREDISQTIGFFDKIMSADRLNIESDLTQMLTRLNVHNHPESLSFLRKLRTSGPFRGMKTKDGQISAIKNHYRYVEPESKFLGQRVDQILGPGGEYRQRTVNETFQIASLKETLKLVLSHETIRTHVENLRPNEDGLLEYFCDGERFAEIGFLTQYPNAIQFVLYYDEVEVANGLGSKCGIHMLAVFYIVILNIPSHLNSKLGAIHVIAIAYYEDILARGFEPILEPFLAELAELESDEGVAVVVNETEMILRACLVGCFGDSKSIHMLLGFLGSGARHFCRLCMLSRRDLHSGFWYGAPRTRELHEQHLLRVVANPAASTSCGVRNRSCIHDARFFHCTSNYIFDRDHDLAEGVIPWEINLVLRQNVCVTRYFEVHE